VKGVQRQRTIREGRGPTHKSKRSTKIKLLYSKEYKSKREKDPIR
jgi:hypothetical protein